MAIIADCWRSCAQIADVEVSSDKAIFCVVGETLKKSKGVVTKIFSTLEQNDIGVGMISLGASEINVTFVVDGKDIRKTAEVLHDAFFGPGHEATTT